MKLLDIRLLCLLFAAFLIGCASHSRENPNAFKLLYTAKIDSEQISKFKDCFLIELDLIRSVSFRTGNREFNFSDFIRIENETSVGTLTSTDINKDGEIQFYRWTNRYISTELEETSFKKCIIETKGKLKKVESL